MRKILSSFVALVIVLSYIFGISTPLPVKATGETIINIGTYEAFGLHAIGNNVYYVFSPKYSGTYIIQTHCPFNGTAQDTILQVFNSNGTLIVSNNDWNGSFYSYVSLYLTYGQSYKIKITTYPDDTSFNCYLTCHKWGSMALEEDEDYSLSQYVDIMKDFKKKANFSPDYNCFAYAIGDPTDNYWPGVSGSGTSLDDVEIFLADLDISKINSYSPSGRCIIAYGNSIYDITHFALSENGVISAKIGGNECVYHSDMFQYYSYGNPVGFFLYNYDD
ncbi:MAG: hypothetical protein J6V01_08585 [Clostridia bacterium]|nr:hypothetical protein [Clostridia bacterium]